MTVAGSGWGNVASEVVRTEGGGQKSPSPPHVSAIAKTSKLGINYMLL
jgi:hypothetical protein